MFFKSKTLPSGILLCLFSLAPAAYGADLGDDRFSSDFGSSWLDDSDGSARIKHGPWDLSISGGVSISHKIDTTIDTPSSYSTFYYSGFNYFINFPASSYAVKSLSNGYTANISLVREIVPWTRVGLKGGASWGHSQTVETGQSLFYFLDSLGNILSTQTLGYTVKYKFLSYHLEPTLEFGPKIPIGKWTCRPYGTIGGGVYQTIETVLFNIANVDTEVARRSRSYFGTSSGVGFDVLPSPSTSIGLQYHYQRIFANPHDFSFSTLTARFSYLF